MKILLQDGGSILRLENFRSSLQMDLMFMFTCLLIKMLQILLTLGRLKTNNGNQNYNIAIGIECCKIQICSDMV